MPLMSVFEPLFVVLVLTTIVTLGVSAVLAIRGRHGRARGVLRRLGVGIAVYFAVVIGVSIVNPQREYRVGDPQCFDDWCITVVDVKRDTADRDGGYEVAFRLSSRARRRPMGEK